MPYFNIFGAVAVLLMMWCIYTRRSLELLDENIKSAMNQIGAQLSSRWDALSDLMDLIRDRTEHEYKTLSNIIKARCPITAENSVRDVTEQENLLAEAMGRVATAAEQCPSLKTDAHFCKTMESINRYEGMTHQSRLIYNDSVTCLNRRIGRRPTSFLAKAIGFNPREYLETHDIVQNGDET